ncbi:MAG: hypothetical protein ABIH66_09195 [bacterium]
MTVDYKTLFALILKRFPATLLISFVTAVLAFSISFLKPETFEAKTRIFITGPQMPSAFNLESAGLFSGILSRTTGHDYIYSLLRSNTIAEEVIESLNLDEDERIIPKKARDDRIKATMAFRSHVAIEVGKNQNIDISVRSGDPELSSVIANEIVETLADHFSKDLSKEEEALRKLSDEIKENTIRIENEILNMQINDDEILLMDARTSNLTDTVSQLYTKKIEGEITKQALEAVRKEAGSYGLASELNRRLIEQEASVKGYEKQLEESQEKIKNLSPKYLEYIRLKKELTFYETLYKLLLSRYESAAIGSKMGVKEFNIIDKAWPNYERVSPIRRKFALFGFAIGLVLSAAFLIFPQQRLFILPETTEDETSE